MEINKEIVKMIYKMANKLPDFRTSPNIVEEQPTQKFQVVGAGDIKISESITCTCGGKEGFSIGVSWGRHGYAGGVLDKEEAIKLAKFIMRAYNLDKLNIKEEKDIEVNII